MLIARSLWRKIVATLVTVVGFVVLYEATIFDSRFSTRQVLDVAPATSAGEARRPVAPPSGATPTLRFGASAYCTGTLTASGVVPRTGIAAADESLLPVGSVIQVTSLGPLYNGVYTIMDTGPMVTGYNIDLYVKSCDEAIRFGRRTASVVVLRLGWNPRDTAPTLFERLLDLGNRAAESALPRRKH
jgi:3D (Asp-Asp-Asp) domain-containing protein